MADKDQDPFRKAFLDLQAAETSLHDVKRNDYTGGAHPLSNYAETAKYLDISTALVIAGRMREKLHRAGNLLRGTERLVEDESLADTFLDLGILAKLCILAVSAADRNEVP